MKNSLAFSLFVCSLPLAAACSPDFVSEPDAGQPDTGTPASRRAVDDEAADRLRPPPTTEGPWGTWQMVVLNGREGVPAEGSTPPIELELRPNGEAYRWHCARATTGVPDEATPCPAESRYECLVGSVAWDGGHWRVDFPEIRVGGTPEQGEIVKDAGGGILVRYIYPTYSGGFFRRTEGPATRGPACVP